MTTINVYVLPDDFTVVVEDENIESTDHYALVELVDENGETLVDEDGETLGVVEATTGNVMVVNVLPDDLMVVVEED